MRKLDQVVALPLMLSILVGCTLKAPSLVGSHGGRTDAAQQVLTEGYPTDPEDAAFVANAPFMLPSAHGFAWERAVAEEAADMAIDPTRTAQGVGEAVPGQRYLDVTLGPVEDQGKLNSCTAFAVKAALEAQSNPIHQLSALDLYYHTRKTRNGNVMADAGATLKDALDVVTASSSFGVGTKTGIGIGRGCMEDSYWPYSDSETISVYKAASKKYVTLKVFQAEPPTASAAVANAARYVLNRTPLRIANPTPGGNVRLMREYLAHGVPVVFGAKIYRSAFVTNPDAASTQQIPNTDGVLPLPGNVKGDKAYGASAFLVIGYNDAKTYTDAKGNVHSGMFMLRSSWGEYTKDKTSGLPTSTPMGDHGYYYMPYDYVIPSLVTDIWAVSGSPIGTSPAPAPVANTGLPVVMADKYTSIQAALNAVADTGGTVYLSPGTYTLTTSLVIASHVSLLGITTRSSTGDILTPILRLADGANVDVIVNKGAGGTQDTDITLGYFQIDGNRLGQPGNAGRHGVYFNNVERLVCESLVVRNCAGMGLFLRSCNHGTVRNGDFSYNGLTKDQTITTSGINLNDDCSDNLIENNSCNYNNWQRLFNADGTFKDTRDGNGIRLGDGSDRNTVRGNYCKGNGRRGIKVQGSYNTVTNNELVDNQGLSLGVHGQQTIGNLVQDNRITTFGIQDNLMAGIYLQGKDGVNKDNTFSGNYVGGAQYGVYQEPNVTGSRFLGNTIELTSGHGVCLFGSSHNLIQKNTFIKIGKRGKPENRYNAVQLASGSLPPVQYESEYNVIEGNICPDGGVDKQLAYGVRSLSGVNNTTVIQNDFRGTLYGLLLADTDLGGTVSGNVLPKL